jgi:hypothetical protein
MVVKKGEAATEEAAMQAGTEMDVVSCGDGWASAWVLHHS